MQGKERVANWLGSVEPRLQHERPPETPKHSFHTMLQPMEPTIHDVYAGTGTVRFHPAVNSYYGGGNQGGKRYESFSGYSTPTRGYGTLSPVALSAMTAPTPRINSSMWSSMEMAVGDADTTRPNPPPFPHGYDPSKPYVSSGSTAAYSLRPQEVYGSVVVNPQESMNSYVQNRGGDVVIQPSRQPVRLPPVGQAEFGYRLEGPSSGVIGGYPDRPVYFPRLPDKSEVCLLPPALRALLDGLFAAFNLRFYDCCSSTFRWRPSTWFQRVSKKSSTRKLGQDSEWSRHDDAVAHTDF